MSSEYRSRDDELIERGCDIMLGAAAAAALAALAQGRPSWFLIFAAVVIVLAIAGSEMRR